MESKAIIRRRIIDLRDGMSSDDRAYLDGRLCKRVVSSPDILKASVVMIYVSYKSEVDTIEIIKKFLIDGKKVAVPKVTGEDIDFYLIDSLDDLEEGYKGISEPKSGCNKYVPSGDEIIIVPGTVFDKRLFRIGYGKGYYDRYLAKYKGLTAIGLAYDFQVVDEIPVDTWDRGMNFIISEKEIYKY